MLSFSHPCPIFPAHELAAVYHRFWGSAHGMHPLTPQTDLQHGHRQLCPSPFPTWDSISFNGLHLGQGVWRNVLTPHIQMWVMFSSKW